MDERAIAARTASTRSVAYRTTWPLTCSQARWPGVEMAPVLDSDQDNVDPLAISREGAAGIEQLLKHLVIGGKLDRALDAQFVHPVAKRIVDRLGRERRRDDELIRRLGRLFKGCGSLLLMTQGCVDTTVFCALHRSTDAIQALGMLDLRLCPRAPEPAPLYSMICCGRRVSRRNQ